MAHAAGFRAAFAASGGLTRRGADPWCLPRIGIGQFSMPAFRFATSGASASGAGANCARMARSSVGDRARASVGLAIRQLW
jgi:hypothetical protein